MTKRRLFNHHILNSFLDLNKKSHPEHLNLSHGDFPDVELRGSGSLCLGAMLLNFFSLSLHARVFPLVILYSEVYF
jgi:hypothetical protein